MWPSWRRETRVRDGDPDLWGALYDRFNPEPDTDPGRGHPRSGPGRPPLTDDSKARLLDAALGIVGSVRVFFEVAEDVLLDQRERMRHAPPREAARPADRHEPPRDPGRAPVQDIPMERP